MFTRLGQVITRYGGWVLVAWMALVAGVKFLAPAWDSVTLDGDFAYLPDSAVSIQAERLLDQAFPDHRTKSQIVLLAARPEGKLTDADFLAADSLALPFLQRIGVEQLVAAQARTKEMEAAQAAGDADSVAAAQRRRERALDAAHAALDEAIAIVEKTKAAILARKDADANIDETALIAEAAKLDEPTAVAYHNRALVQDLAGKSDEAEDDRGYALFLNPKLADEAGQPIPRDVQPGPLLGAWTRHNDFAGKQLPSKDGQAVLMVLQLSTEFMAIENVPLLKQVTDELDRVRGELAERGAAGLHLGVTGSAAIGADMLDSARESLDRTELLTVLFVVVILLVVYRAPMLVVVPLACIIVSIVVATGLVAALTQVGIQFGLDWWTFKVFKTTKIFIVVILFGCGTDYCLFLIARYKEELEAGRTRDEALQATLEGTGDAISASALTSILGLGMMFFAEFGKFSNSGLAIGLCLLVTMCACITFAPALLQLVAPIAFWPWGDPEKSVRPAESLDDEQHLAWYDLVWKRVADAVLARPAFILVASVLLLAWPAYMGLDVPVTYDLLSELAPHRPSKLGTELLRKHYPVGESGPVVVVAVKEGAEFNSPEGIAKIEDLTKTLVAMPGVQMVRSMAEPLGLSSKPDETPSEKPAPRKRGGRASFTKLAMRNHHITRDLFLAQDPKLQPNTARFELILDSDPFSNESFAMLDKIKVLLDAAEAKEDSPWKGARFAYSGTTASIRDLRDVTTRDTFWIKIYVLLAVYLVLLVIIRQTLMCTFLMVSVVFSFYVTMGITVVTFSWLYGDTFGGIDWKVPLYLFVILVAIGQDYNIYLVTRVLEEQAIHGPTRGLHVAVVRTGSIITSCGIIMAGSFMAMMAGTLRAMIELGFALSLGVLLDTMIIRPIIVPTFISLTLPWMKLEETAVPAAEESAIDEMVESASNGESNGNGHHTNGHASDTPAPTKVRT